MRKIILLSVGAVELYAGWGISPVEPIYSPPIQQIEIQQDKMFYAYVMVGNSIHFIQNKRTNENAHNLLGGLKYEF